MAVTQADFNRIWASTSPLRPYNFSNTNYLQGWNFVGSTPPARQMWDKYMNLADQKMQYLANNYLPLSGGTINGDLSFTGGSRKINFSNGKSQVASFDNGVYVYGDTADKSSSFTAFTNENGNGFQINAGDGTTQSRMVGKPDGTLTWNNKEIATTEFVNAKAGNYLPLSGGTLTGVVNGVTPPNGDNSKKLATTEFVNAKAGNYLPLSGGTINGDLSFTGGSRKINFSNGKSQVASFNNGVYVSGDTADKQSSFTAFTNENGNGFQINAGDGTTQSRMVGKPDGTLTWNNKEIATTEFVNAKAGNYLPLSGGTLTGVVNGVTPPNGDNSKKLATTEFVNAKAGNYLPLSGGTINGDLSFTGGGRKISFSNGKSQVASFDNGVYVYGDTADKQSSFVAFTNENGSGFHINAGDGTTQSRMVGKPDGTLTWDGQPLLPVGIVQAFAGTTIPNGWLLCDGSAVSRTTYAKLFSVIGTTYGSGNGSTTFNLPNLTDKFIQGSGTVGTVKAAGLPNITGMAHALVGPNTRIAWDTKDTTTGLTGPFFATGQAGAYASGVTTNGETLQQNLNFDASRSSSVYGNSTTVQPPALTMRYIIKY